MFIILHLLWFLFNAEITYYVNWDFTFHFEINRELPRAIFELIVYSRHVSMCVFHLLWMQVSGWLMSLMTASILSPAKWHSGVPAEGKTRCICRTSEAGSLHCGISSGLVRASGFLGHFRFSFGLVGGFVFLDLFLSTYAGKRSAARKGRGCAFFISCVKRIRWWIKDDVASAAWFIVVEAV